MASVPLLTLEEKTRGRPFAAEIREYRRTGGWYDRHDYFSLALVSRGLGSVRLQSNSVSARRTPIASGDLFFLRPADVTSWYPEDDDGFDLTFVSFPIGSWQAFARLSGVGTNWERAAEPPRVSLGANAAAAAESFELIIEKSHDSPTMFDLLGFWVNVVPRVLEVTPDRVAAELPDWLVRSMRAMREEGNLRGGFSRFVELSHVSPGYLAATTRRHFGRTPVGLVAEWRLRHASGLLRTSSASIGEVAERCGYSSINYFSGCFRREYGVSPSTYRSRIAFFPPGGADGTQTLPGASSSRIPRSAAAQG